MTDCCSYLPPATKVLMHSNMVDYFTGKWADCVKPITFSKKKKGVYSEAKRGIPEMPCLFEKNAFNYRKLSELPYHLNKCARHVDFISYVCYDFDVSYSAIVIIVAYLSCCVLQKRNLCKQSLI